MTLRAFLFYSIFLLTPVIARHGWPRLGRDSKRLRNTGLDEL